MSLIGCRRHWGEAQGNAGASLILSDALWQGCALKGYLQPRAIEKGRELTSPLRVPSLLPWQGSLKGPLFSPPKPHPHSPLTLSHLAQDVFWSPQASSCVKEDGIPPWGRISSSPGSHRASDSRADLISKGSCWVWRVPSRECLRNRPLLEDIRGLPLLFGIPSGCPGGRSVEGTKPAKGCPGLDSTAVYPVRGSATGWTSRRSGLTWLQAQPWQRLSMVPSTSPRHSSGWEPGLASVLVCEGLMGPGLVGHY